MTSFSPNTNPASTAVPGSMVTPAIPPSLSSGAQTNQLARLIDERRALAAQVAGKDVEIAMALGDRDAAKRALKEMEAQTVARQAMREAGCFFVEAADSDRRALRGRVPA